MPKKKCLFCKENIIEIDFTDKELLSRFLSETGKIYSKRKTHLCSKHQRKMKKAVKRARVLGLLPFVVQ
jgi:small subunit ribosomal protein S18